MNWNKPPFRMRTLGTSVRTGKTEEVPSERAVQHGSVQLANQSMYHVSEKAKWEPLATSGSCISKGGYQPPLTKLNRIT